MHRLTRFLVSAYLPLAARGQLVENADARIAPASDPSAPRAPAQPAIELGAWRRAASRDDGGAPPSSLAA